MNALWDLHVLMVVVLVIIAILLVLILMMITSIAGERGPLVLTDWDGNPLDEPEIEQVEQDTPTEPTLADDSLTIEQRLAIIRGDRERPPTDYQPMLPDEYEDLDPELLAVLDEGDADADRP